MTMTITLSLDVIKKYLALECQSRIDAQHSNYITEALYNTKNTISMLSTIEEADEFCYGYMKMELQEWADSL